MTGLNTKTAEQNLSIVDTNTKLDSIILILEALPPPATATLDDVLAALVVVQDNISALVPLLEGISVALRDTSEADIADDTESISGLLYRLRRAVAPPNIGDTTLSIQTGVSNIINVLTSYWDITNSYLEDMYDAVRRSFRNLGLNTTADSYTYAGWLKDSGNWFGRISGGIGVPVDSGTNENVIELLARMANKPDQPVNQGNIPQNVCSDAFISDAMQLVPSPFDTIWTTLVFAQWPDTNEYGIEFGSIFGIGIDKTELVMPIETWAGYGLYVSSSADNFGLYIGADEEEGLQRYPTNVWLSLDNISTNLGIFVGGEESVRAYLCRDGWGGGSSSGGPWGGDNPGTWSECVQIGSKYAVFTEPNGFTLSCWHAAMSQLPGTSYGNVVNIPAVENPVTGSDSDWFWYGDAFGFLIKLDTGDRIRIVTMNEAGSFENHSIDTVGATFEVTTHSTVLWIDTRENNPETENTEFSVTICPSP